jgi:DNA-binding MarR family transcriptional regulator
MTSPRLSTSDYRALARFRRALRRFQRFSETAARRTGLTPAQHQLLLAIRGHDGDGPPTVADVAESLQLKHHSTVELIDRASSNSLVARRPDADDARRVRLALTAHGEEKLAELSVQHREELRRFRAEMIDILHELD